MKQILGLFLVTFSMNVFAAQPKEVTVCGTYQIRSSDGFMQVIVNELLVEMPAPMEGFQHYRLSASGKTYAEVERGSKFLKMMRQGNKYCVTGPLSNQGGKLEIEIRNVRTR